MWAVYGMVCFIPFLLLICEGVFLLCIISAILGARCLVLWFFFFVPCTNTIMVLSKDNNNMIWGLGGRVHEFWGTINFVFFSSTIYCCYQRLFLTAIEWFTFLFFV